MNLKNNLYTVIAHEANGYTVRMNPASVIYAAHFPGQPITPGVCIVQMVTELAEDALGCPLATQELLSVKFLSMLTPDNGTNVQCILDLQPSTSHLKPPTFQVKALVRNDETTFAKLSLSCKKK